MIYLVAFAAQFAFIFMKAFQQRNVVFDHFGLVVPTSMVMGMFEVLVWASVIKAIATGSIILVGLSIGIGGGLGAVSAMKTHRMVTEGKYGKA